MRTLLTLLLLCCSTLLYAEDRYFSFIGEHEIVLVPSDKENAHFIIDYESGALSFTESVGGTEHMRKARGYIGGAGGVSDAHLNAFKRHISTPVITHFLIKGIELVEKSFDQDQLREIGVMLTKALYLTREEANTWIVGKITELQKTSDNRALLIQSILPYALNFRDLIHKDDLGFTAILAYGKVQGTKEAAEARKKEESGCSIY